MNWTSTKVPMWQIDCENYRIVGRPFELRDATKKEHAEFVRAFAEKHGLSWRQDGATFIFGEDQTS